MQRSVRILLAGLVPLLIIVLHPVMRHLHAQERRCFAETGYCIEGRVLDFWEQHGGLAIFGYPLTSERWDVIEGTSLRVQWFERVRIEFQPQADAPSDIQLGRLGSEVLARTGHDWRDFSHGPARGTCRFFPETGYQVCDDFLTFWSSHGVQQDDAPEISPQESLALFGLPLGNEQTSTLNDGRVIIVQWFERARLERFLDRQAGTVHLGLLGRENLLVRTHNVIPIPTNTVRPSEFWVTMPDLVGLEKNVARSQLRIHAYLPGWEIPKLRPDSYASDYGFITDYFCEIMHELRRFELPGAVRSRFELFDAAGTEQGISGRDQRAITKTTSGLIKLLYPCALS
jgi:hypothetical protein